MKNLLLAFRRASLVFIAMVGAASTGNAQTQNLNTLNLTATPTSLVLPASLSLTTIANPTPMPAGVPTGTVSFFYDSTNLLGTGLLSTIPSSQKFPATPFATPFFTAYSPAGMAFLTVPGTGHTAVMAAGYYSGSLALYDLSTSLDSPSIYYSSGAIPSGIDTVVPGYFLNPKSTGISSVLVHSSQSYAIFDGSIVTAGSGNQLAPAKQISTAGCGCDDQQDSEAIAIDDFDGDGYSDIGAILFSSYGSDPIAGVTLNAGSTNPGAFPITGENYRALIQIPQSATFFCPIAITTGHFTSAVGAQLAVLGQEPASGGCYNAASTDPRAIQIYTLNTSTSLLQVGSVAVDATATTLAAADLNLDGKTDLIIGESTLNGLRVATSNGDGSFAAPSALISTINQPVSFAINDFNGDGSPDVSVALSDGAGGGGFAVLLNDGAGNLQQATEPYALTETPLIASSDINKDGLADIALIIPEPNNIEASRRLTKAHAAPRISVSAATGVFNFDLSTASATATLTTGTSPMPAGMHTLTATLPASANFPVLNSNAVTETVSQTASTISWAPPAAIEYGTPLGGAQLNATANVPGTFVYTPAAGALLPPGTNTLNVSFTPTDSTDQSGSTAAQTIVVNAPALSSVSPLTAIAGSSNVTLAMTGTGFVRGAIVQFAGTTLGTTYIDQHDLSAVVPASLLATAGNFAITATDPGGIPIAGSTTFVVSAKTVPVITWPAPAAIEYGTPLSSTQLDATASLPGTFVYTPAAGTVLMPGSNSLAVAFTPTDASTTANSSANQSLTVSAPTLVSVSPNSVKAGSPATSITVTGTGFVTGAIINFGGTPLATTYIDQHHLSAIVPATSLTTASTAVVTTADPGVPVAGSQTFTTVAKTVPVITWLAPSAIEYGTALSGAQLNATASVPGTFVYTPAAGAILPPGSSTLATAFTPTDTLNNAGATANQTVTVAAPSLLSVSPNSVKAGSPATTITVTGTGFVSGAIVSFGGTPLSSAYVDQHHLSAVIPAASLTTASTAVITAADPGVAVTGSQIFTVVAKTAPVLTWPAPTAIEYGTPLSSTQLDATASVLGIFAYTPAAGAILPPGSNALTAAFTPTDTLNNAGGNASQTLLVNGPTLLSVSPSSVKAGSPNTIITVTGTGFVFGASINYGGAPLATTYIDQHHVSAVITAPSLTKAGTAAITATDPNSIAITGSLVFTISAKTIPVITWSAPAALEYGTALSATQLNATASVPGTFVYTPALGALPPPGTNSLTAVFTPTDTLNNAGNTATQALTVNAPSLLSISPATTKAGAPATTITLTGTGFVAGATVSYSGKPLATTFVDQHHLSAVIPATLLTTVGTGAISVADPNSIAVVGSQTFAIVAKTTAVITWTTPTAIEYGTALSVTQLNATANIPGTFVYTPPAGTIAVPGTTSLLATFTPSDTLNNTGATATQTVTVSTPTLVSVSPLTAKLGDPAATITIVGTGFVHGATASYGGKPLVTTYVDQHHLTAIIPSTLLTTAGSVTIAVADPSSIVVTGSQTFVVTASSAAATATAPATVAAAQQSSISLIVTPYPVPITATVVLSFQPTAPNTVGDPMVVFANNETSYTLPTIDANSLATIPPIDFQAGSTAGIITATFHLVADGVDITPATLLPVTITVPAQVPSISTATLTRTLNGFQIVCQGLSSTREVTQATFHLTAAAGKSLAQTDFTIPLTPVFLSWYQSSTSDAYGTTFTYTQPFTLDGDGTDVASVTITLSNSLGESSPMAVQ